MKVLKFYSDCSWGLRNFQVNVFYNNKVKIEKIKTVELSAIYNKGYQTFVKVDILNEVWKVAQTTCKVKR